MKQNRLASSQLKNTLMGLDDAIKSWESVLPDASPDAVDATALGGARSSATSVREEQARALHARARELLEKLKLQLEDLDE